jgi:hypothetical protein
MPPQCGDGKIGDAVFVSQTPRNYISHISALGNNSYMVTFYPKLGIPERFVTNWIT